MATVVYDPTPTDFILFGGKTCTGCGAERPANSEHFDRDRSRPDGLKARCKNCVAVRGADYYRRTKEARP